MSSHVVPHHFESAEQAYNSSKLGVWLFLVTEILLFGILFVTYITYRSIYPEMFHAASHHLDRVMGGINTVVLICSSLTMAFAVQMTKENKNDRAGFFLFLTLVFAATFMVIKYFEYTHKFHDGLLPGQHFAFKELKDVYPNAGLFFSIYFMMTGLHGFHVLVGMFLIAWMMKKSFSGQVGSTYYTPVEATGLYWHLVDLIWIYLFPLLYLVG